MSAGLPSRSWQKFVLVFAALCLVVPALLAEALPEHFFGMNVLHAINKTPWPDAKVNSIRLWDTDDTRWSTLEPSRGQFDWTGLDRWLALAEKHRVQVIYTFGRVPAWANFGKAQSVPPTNLDDWDTFVRAIVRHSKGRISAWELWNEPNDPKFWTGDIKTLIQMSERAYRIIKSEQPNAIVLTPSATWHEGMSASQWFRLYFAADGGKFADVIAFHGYVGLAPEALTREIDHIRQAARAASIDKPIWDTESSWGMDAKLVDPSSQAAFLARSYIIHASQGVHRFYWYAWDGSDGRSSSSESWGTLWDRDGVRPAGRALKMVSGWLQEAELPLLCETSNTIWTCSLNPRAALVWDTATEHTYSVDPRFSRYSDLGGQSYAIAADKLVMIGKSPILLQSTQ